MEVMLICFSSMESVSMLFRSCFDVIARSVHLSRTLHCHVFHVVFDNICHAIHVRSWSKVFDH